MDNERLRVRRGWAIYLLPIFVGAIIRVLWAWWNPHLPVWDELEYHALAVRITQGEPYGVPFWPPSYPYLLAIFYALFGASEQVAVWLNTVASIAAVPLLGLLARRLFDQRTAVIGMWIAAVTPSFILANVLVRYDVLNQVLLLVALLVALRGAWRWPIVALIAGIAALLAGFRAYWLVLPVILWMVARLTLKTPVSWRRVAVTQVLAVLLVVPWVVHASEVSGRFVPISLNGGMNLWIGNNPEATGRYMGPPGEYWTAEYDAEAARVAVEYILTHPLKTLALMPTKIWFSLWGEPWVEWVFAKTTVTFPEWLPASIKQGMDLFLAAQLAAATLAIALLLYQRRFRVVAPLLLLGASVAMQAPFWGSPRARWVVQFLVILYAAALPTALAALRERRLPSTAAAAPALKRPG